MVSSVQPDPPALLPNFGNSAQANLNQPLDGREGAGDLLYRHAIGGDVIGRADCKPVPVGAIANDVVFVPEVGIAVDVNHSKRTLNSASGFDASSNKREHEIEAKGQVSG